MNGADYTALLNAHSMVPAIARDSDIVSAARAGFTRPMRDVSTKPSLPLPGTPKMPRMRYRTRFCGSIRHFTRLKADQVFTPG